MRTGFASRAICSKSSQGQATITLTTDAIDASFEDDVLIESFEVPMERCAALEKRANE
jgi:hypothetical protein